MRSLNTSSLSLYLYHQLRSRLGTGEEARDGTELEDDQLIRLLVSILNEIPGLEAKPAQGLTIAIRFAGSDEIRILRVQNVIDSLRIIWNEFQESTGDRRNA